MALIDNLSSWWSFDETSGNAADSHGSNTLTQNVGPGSVSGKVGNARSLVRTSSQYFNKSDVSTLKPGSAFTFQIWIYQNSSVSGPSVMLQKWAVGGGPILHTTDGADIKLFHTGSGGDYATVTGVMSANTWYHIVLVYDGTGVTNADKLKIYVNGVSQTLTFVGTNFGASISDNSSDFEIGRWPTLSYHSTFYVDEAAFWQRALSSSEVTQLYNGGDGLAYSALLATTISVFDTISVVESITISAQSTLSASLFDSITLTESSTALLISSIQSNEVIIISELVNVSILFDISIFDTISINESVNILNQLFISSIDAINIGESVNILNQLFVSVNDAISINELTSILDQLVISSVDIISINESVSILGQLFISGVDVININESVSALNQSFVLTNDVVSINESIIISNQLLSIIIYEAVSSEDIIGIVNQSTRNEAGFVQAPIETIFGSLLG